MQNLCVFLFDETSEPEGFYQALQEKLNGGVPSSDVPIECDHCKDVQTCQTYLEDGPYSIAFIALDLRDPFMTPQERLAPFLSADHDISVPIIILTDEYDESLVEYALSNGVQDYVLKSRLSGENIYRIMEYSMKRHKLQQKLEETLDQVEAKAQEILDSQKRVLKFMTDMKRPLVSTFKALQTLEKTTMQPEQKQRLHMALAASEVMRIMLDELQDDIPLPQQETLQESHPEAVPAPLQMHH